MDTSLLGLFVDNYEDFRRRLRRRLPSDDLVDDALQETYLKVERLDAASDRAVQPMGYLFRMALNMATDQHRASRRLLTGEEIDELIHGAGDSLDPPTVLSSRQDLAALSDALSALTRRQRDILIAARVDELPQADIAARHGISVRMVGKELKKALETCATKVGRQSIQRFGPGAGESS
ncbi:sigma-70 family RNA polymerase sigma factor [Luteibacter flocculans]|uniref:Sigma-70 family RNA polymerase sigma factor n=1 Tax=Luteibacter flocculans TaxID=2780091 RepID=A0ABY4SWH8_9GAMM|nr:sigma-70 family RNA polymerase sigma factor [Luteibacter flocculans]URL57059.1 sigma-70 family RNA polymerase sigma factor [Luteibacter flocculans]